MFLTSYLNNLWRRANKFDALLTTSAAELSIFGKEAIAWVNSVDFLLLRDLDQTLDIQIAPHRCSILITDLI